jgi:gas vesicle protein
VAKKDKGTFYTLFGVLAGAAVGAALGLVNSRGTGEQNRKAMLDWGQHRAENLQRKAQGQLQAVQQKAEDRIGQVRHETEQRVDALKHTAEDRLDTVRHKVEDTAGSLTGKVRGDTDGVARTADRVTEWVEGNVESALPETPGSSTGPGQGSGPAL